LPLPFVISSPNNTNQTSSTSSVAGPPAKRRRYESVELNISGGNDSTNNYTARDRDKTSTLSSTSFPLDPTPPGSTTSTSASVSTNPSSPVTVPSSISSPVIAGTPVLKNYSPKTWWFQHGLDRSSPTTASTVEASKRLSFYTPILTVRWMRHYEELQKFKTQFGHCNASRKNKTWKSLGHWVRQQRRKKKQGKLSDHQTELLNKLGFEWDRSYFLHKKEKRLEIDMERERAKANMNANTNASVESSSTSMLPDEVSSKSSSDSEELPVEQLLAISNTSSSIPVSLSDLPSSSSFSSTSTTAYTNQPITITDGSQLSSDTHIMQASTVPMSMSASQNRSSSEHSMK